MRSDGEWHTLGVVAMVLVVAFAFQTSTLAEPVAAALVVLAVAAVAALAVAVRFGPHVVRTGDGRAFIYTRRVAGEPVRVMRTHGVYQSATFLGERRFEPVFAYHRAFDRVLDAAPRRAGVQRVLALGGGGYAWPKHVLTERADVAVDVVEIDPAITAAARRWFYVDELADRVGAADGFCDGATARLGLVTADARAIVDDAATPVYDAIVNDVFRGAEPVRTLATVEAARAMRGHLAPGGVVGVNVVSRAEGADLSFLRDVVATLGAVFAHVAVYPAVDEELGGEENYLVCASDAALDETNAIPYDADFLGEVLRDRG